MTTAQSTLIRPLDGFRRDNGFSSQAPKWPGEDSQNIYMDTIVAAGRKLLERQQEVYKHSQLGHFYNSAPDDFFIVAGLKSALLSHFLPKVHVATPRAFSLFITQQTPDAVEIQSLLAYINANGDAQITSSVPEQADLPDYSYALERIRLFANEEVNWDGCGGLPASPRVVKDVVSFLTFSRLASIEEPSLAMGGDGSVAVVWAKDDLYISADFDGAGNYVFFVSQASEFLTDGVSSSTFLDKELSLHLKKHFHG
ncbi:hypothetical protein [Pseudomonas sp. Irchel 3A7]|uniref:hypothetical protein n=1 Tax=Pseudomonas sp. Irchel 3A7 TaxID=2008913 RepID=UPI0011405A04|nr:hypothetical protein [Pseudomonas sp. Irchel 3A7]